MDTETEFEFIPFFGAGELRFGMKPIEVASTVGAPEYVSTSYLNQKIEFRSFMNVAYSEKEESLVHFGFGRQMKNVTYKNTSLFREDGHAVLEKLILDDQKPFIYLGFIVLINLGMTLTGFHDGDLSQKAIALFPRGAWDKRLHKLKPYRI